MRASGESRTVAVAGVDFGWGSSGKLSAVLAALQSRGGERSRFVGLASGLGRPVLAGSPVERWFDLPEAEPERELARIVREQQVAAALVVLDGGLARALGDCGVPVVFVDSLPFLWTEGDRAELPWTPRSTARSGASTCRRSAPGCWPTCGGCAGWTR